MINQQGYVIIINSLNFKQLQYRKLLQNIDKTKEYYLMNEETGTKISHEHVKEKCERMIMKIENEKEKITGLYYVSKKI